MAFRLIFTSSPSSLTGSRTGFCTVARSAEMSEKLALCVEKCGTYDHDAMRANPIFSHRKIWLGDKNYHILSRITDSGADYTNRSNYIADHLVLTEDETQLVPSPAQAILEFDGWMDSYEGAPKFLESVPIKKSAQKFAPPSSMWQDYFLDAGKAALMLSESADIYAKPEDGKTLLKLFAQASALCAPEAKSWDYTFTTSICRGENPQDFSWKVYTNTPPEIASANSSAINLTSRKAPPAPNTPAAVFARTAKISNKDRLNLKVQKPSEFKPKIKIARNIQESESKISPEFKRNSLLAACVLLAAAIAAMAVFLFAKSGEDEFGARMQIQKNSYMSNIPLSEPVEVRSTYSKIRAEVKDLTNDAKWQEALSLWENANLEDFNPKARPEILSDMGKKFDEILSEAEESAESQDKAKALALLKKALPALEIKDFPNKTKRARMMEGLKLKVQKL